MSQTTYSKLKAIIKQASKRDKKALHQSMEGYDAIVRYQMVEGMLNQPAGTFSKNVNTVSKGKALAKARSFCEYNKLQLSPQFEEVWLSTAPSNFLAMVTQGVENATLSDGRGRSALANIPAYELQDIVQTEVVRALGYDDDGRYTADPALYNLGVNVRTKYSAILRRILTYQGSIQSYRQNAGPILLLEFARRKFKDRVMTAWLTEVEKRQKLLAEGQGDPEDNKDYIRPGEVGQSPRENSVRRRTLTKQRGVGGDFNLNMEVLKDIMLGESVEGMKIQIYLFDNLLGGDLKSVVSKQQLHKIMLLWRVLGRKYGNLDLKSVMTNETKFGEVMGGRYYVRSPGPEYRPFMNSKDQTNNRISLNFLTIIHFFFYKEIRELRTLHTMLPRLKVVNPEKYKHFVQFKYKLLVRLCGKVPADAWLKWELEEDQGQKDALERKLRSPKPDGLVEKLANKLIRTQGITSFRHAVATVFPRDPDTGEVYSNDSEISPLLEEIKKKHTQEAVRDGRLPVHKVYASQKKNASLKKSAQTLLLQLIRS